MCAQKSWLYSKKIMGKTIYQKRMEERRKKQGLCIKCGKPMDREGVHCVGCRKIISRRQRLLRVWYKEHGICPVCGKQDLFGDEKSCLECRAKRAKWYYSTMEQRDLEKINTRHAELSKIRHKKRIDEGICTRCGKRKSDGGFKTCGICRAKTRDYKRMKYGKPDRSERIEKGLCYFCDNPAKEGYKVCEEHYQKNVENARSSRAAQAREKLLKEGILY